MATTFAQVNPLSNVQVGSISTMGSIAIVVGIVLLILMGIGFLIFINVVKKKYYIKIKVFRNVGNTPTLVSQFACAEIPFGMAGDKLWRVAPMSALTMAFKIVKWLPVGKKQSAPNEFWYWIREDGEWINFMMSDIDKISRDMGVKFVQEDMRLQRLATDRLLEQRLMNKSFWDKWGNTIMTIIFFLVISVCMVIIFYQWSKLLDKMIPLVDVMTRTLDIVQTKCALNSTGGASLIPVK